LSRKPTSVQTAEVGASPPVARVWTKDRLPPQSRAYRSRALADDGLRVDGLARVAALRALEPQVLAQGRAFVFGAKQAARLQFRDHQIDEILNPARQVGRITRNPSTP
jgi:hypothetical protein